MPTITADEVLLTADDYHRMIAADILTEDDRVELIDGRITPMAAVGGAHIYTANRLTELFVKHVGPDIDVSVQNPVEIAPHQEPEPDVALIRRLGEPRTPRAVDTPLIAEVADTTLRQDRTVKLPRYAAASIPQARIVNLEDNRLEVYTEPSGSTYAQKRTFAPDDEIALPHTQKTTRVSDLLP